MAKLRASTLLATLALGLAIGPIGTAQNFTLGVDYAVIGGVIDSTPPYSVCAGDGIALRLRYSWANPFQEYVYTEPSVPLAPHYLITAVTPNPSYMPASSSGNPAVRFVDVSLTASSQGTSGAQQALFRGRTSGFFGNPIMFANVSVPLETLLVPSATEYLELADGITDMPTRPWFSWSENSGTSNRLDVAICSNPGAPTPAECGETVMGSPVAADCGESEYCWIGAGRTHRMDALLAPDAAYRYRVVSSNMCGTNDSSSTMPRPYFRTAQACFVVDGAIPDGGVAVFDVGIDALVAGSQASDLRVTVHTDHADVSDLEITVTKTSPTPVGPVHLVDRQSGSGCELGRRIQAAFADDGAANAGNCNDLEPAINGRIAPTESLGSFTTVESAGTWRLTVADRDLDGNAGTLLEWCLSADEALSPAAFTPLTAIATPWVIAFGGTSELSAFGGVGSGEVSYAVTAGEANCALNGSTLTGVGVGGCTVTATRAPGATNPENTDNVDISVVRADQTGFTASVSPGTISYGGAAEIVTSGGSGSGLVSYDLTAGALFCAINGSTVTGIGVGVCTVTVTKAADGHYNAATTTVDVTVIRANQSPLEILASPALIGIGAASVLSTTGGSGAGAVSYMVTSGIGFCSVAGNTATGAGVGTCTVTATKAPDANYNPASAAVGIVVFSGDLAGLSLSNVSLSPPFNSGTTSYSVSVENTVLNIFVTASALDPAAQISVNALPIASGVQSPAIALGVGSNSIHVVVTAQDSTNKSYQIELVRRATQAINFPPVSAGVLGDPPFDVLPSGGASGQPVVVNSGAPGVCTTSGLNGVTIALTAAGTCVLYANQAGDAYFDPAPQVSRAFEVQAGADLQISKSNGQHGLAPNAPVVYVIEVGNAGPSNVSAAVLTDLPPAQLLDPQWACIPIQGAACSNPAGSGPINESLMLPAGSILRFELSAIVSAAPGAFVTNTASIGMPTGTVERDPANNIARDIDPVLSDSVYNNGFEAGSGLLDIVRHKKN